MSTIFLSYATKNRDFVDKIRRELEYRNYTTWMDHCEIEGGQEWEIELANNVKNCKIFVVTITDESNESKWVRRETILAEQLQKIRIPLLLQGEVPFRLLDVQFVDFRTSYEEGLSKLLRRLESLLPPPPSNVDDEESMLTTDLLQDEDVQATTLGSTLVNSIIDRWIKKKGTSKVHKIRPPYQSRYRIRDQNHKNNTLRQKQIQQQQQQQPQQAWTKSPDVASTSRHANIPVTTTTPNILPDNRKKIQGKIKGLLFCVPHGWLENEIATEEQAEEDKAFLWSARCDLSGARRQQQPPPQQQQEKEKESNKSGRLASAIEECLEHLLDRMEHSGRTCRSKIKIDATGTIVLRLNVNSKEIGLDLEPNDTNYKLLLEGLESLLSTLLTKSPSSVFLGGTWPGSICVLFRAPGSVLNFIIDRWKGCHNDELVLTNEMSLVGLYHVFSAIVPEKDVEALLGCRTELVASQGELNKQNRLLGLSTTLVDALQGLIMANNIAETDETFERHKVDFVACQLDDDDITLLIPESNHSLEQFTDVESQYWVSGSSLQLGLGGSNANSSELSNVRDEYKYVSGRTDEQQDLGEKASGLSRKVRRKKTIVDQSGMMNQSITQENIGQDADVTPMTQKSIVVEGQVISGQELKKYAEQHGLCTICGQKQTHKKKWSWFRRKFVPLTIRNSQGVVIVYKGYCIRPSCYPSVEFVEELLRGENGKDQSKMMNPSTVQESTITDGTKSLTKEISSFQERKMKTPENPGNTLYTSQNAKALERSNSCLGLDEIHNAGGLVKNLVRIETPDGKPIEEVYDGVHSGPVLGSGVTGIGRLVIHKTTGLKYAVKCFDLGLIGTKEGLAQLREEIVIMCQLDHPNIVRLVEVYESQSEVYLVQELCLGGDLFDRLDEQPDYHCNEKECARLVTQILSAARYLHSKGIMHRDLKLDNFLFFSTEADSELKLIDFGLSKHFRYGEIQHEAVGTPYTVAPEVLKGSYDEKCDIWAIGVITFTLFSGDPPFGGLDGEPLLTVRHKILSGEFTFKPAEIWADASDDGKNFVQTILAKDPKDRPTAREAQRHIWLRESNESKIGPLNPNVIKAMVDFKGCSLIRRLLMNMLSFTLLPDQELELRLDFEKLDYDGSGEISLKAMKEVLSTDTGIGSSRVLKEKEVEEIFNAMMLTKTETRIRWHQFLAANLSQCRVDYRNIHLAFSRLERDHEGYITLDSILDVVGPDEFCSQEEMQEMWREVTEGLDCDQERVPYEKFLILMKRIIPTVTPSNQSKVTTNVNTPK